MADSDDGGAFIWYELMTPDADAAKAFYDKVVGWDIDATSSVPDGSADYRMIKRKDGGFAGGVLGMTQEMLDHGAPPRWLGYIHVPDVDAAAARFKDAGGNVWIAPHDMEGVGRFALVSDAQGAPLYVMKPIPPADNPEGQSDVFSVGQPQHIRWNELSTTDQDAALSFYTGLFGWRQEGEFDMGGMGKYRFIHHGDTRIGAVMTKPPAMPQSAWLYYIGVDDIDRAADAVKSGGGHVAHGPNEIPGGEFTCVCTDPQGVAFGIVGPRK